MDGRGVSGVAPPSDSRETQVRMGAESAMSFRIGGIQTAVDSGRVSIEKGV